MERDQNGEKGACAAVRTEMGGNGFNEPNGRKSAAAPVTAIGIQTPLQKVLAYMRARKLDGVLLRRRSNFAWVTGGGDNHIELSSELGVAALLIYTDIQYCITTNLEALRIHDEELAGLGYKFVVPPWYEGIDQTIGRLTSGQEVAADAPFGNLILLGQDFERLRYSLTEGEINRYRVVSQITARALEDTCREIEPGWTEYEIGAHLQAKVLEEGLTPHCVLIATDERIMKYRHPIPSGKKLRQYAMVVICAEKWGLISNATRLVHFGPLSDELREKKRKVAEIDVAMNSATRPGVPVRQVFLTGVRAYHQAGYPDEWRSAHQGGPTGYATREFLAAPDVGGVVHVHQAFTWNPSIRGAKSEDTILVREQDNEFMTHTGEWAYIEIEKNGVRYLRPDILIR